MKNLILYSLLLFTVLIAQPVTSYSQAHSVKIDSDQDKDSLYVMLTDTVYSKYRHGKGKYINTTSAHAENTFDGCQTYTAVLTQASTSAPTAAVLRNNLGGTVVWTRNSAGNYTGTLAGAFTASKTWVSITNGNSTGLVTDVYRATANTIIVLVFDAAGAAADLAGTASLKVEVYP